MLRRPRFAAQCFNRVDDGREVSSPEQWTLPSQHASNLPEPSDGRPWSDDPLGLRCGLKSKEELVIIARQDRRLFKFHEKQNDAIEDMLKSNDQHFRKMREVRESERLYLTSIKHGSRVVAAILAPLQIYSATSSGSLALIVVSVDTITSLLSYSIIPAIESAVRKIDASHYPAGRSRIETVGHILFRFLVVVTSLVLIAFSINQLVVGSKSASSPANTANKVGTPTIVVSSIAFAINLIWFLYSVGRTEDELVHVLRNDFRDKLIVNGLGVLTTVGGSKLRWWINPGGAIAISCFAMAPVLSSMRYHFQRLIGITAEADKIRFLTYKSQTHSDRIKAVDTVRAWYSGPRIIVEVDIIMDPEECLQTCHDIAEELQIYLEILPFVERAYVHVDYESTHRPEHFLPKEL